jgi:hypothetical protein
MQTYEFWTIVGMIGGAFAWILILLLSIKEEVSGLKERIAKIEGKMEHQEGMLQTIVGFLLGHKTGA